jgi:hypothetical protein
MVTGKVCACWMLVEEGVTVIVDVNSGTVTVIKANPEETLKVAALALSGV